MACTFSNLIGADRGTKPSNIGGVTIRPSEVKYLEFNITRYDATSGLHFFIKGATKGSTQVTVTLEVANHPEQTNWTVIGSAENFGSPSGDWQTAELAFSRFPTSGQSFPPCCRLKISTGSGSACFVTTVAKSILQD